MTGQGKSAIDTLLAESFKELALKHPIEKITIKEITDKAGVIRPTFYNHFQDKYELLEWIIDTQLIAPASCIMKVFLRVFERSAATKKPKYVWLTPERIAAYYAQSMCYVVITWIKSGMTISSKELAEIYNYMIKRSMTDILTEL